MRTILSLFALLSLMGWPFMVLMPVFAAQVLHGGPHTLGFLMGAVGVGSLVSALSLVRPQVGARAHADDSDCRCGLRHGTDRFRLLYVALRLSLPLMLLTGFGMMQGLTASNTIIQTLVDEKMRGRVMSYYTMAFVGMAPFGSLLAGALAHAIGAPHTVIVSGIACILGADGSGRGCRACAKRCGRSTSGLASCRRETRLWKKPRRVERRQYDATYLAGMRG